MKNPNPNNNIPKLLNASTPLESVFGSVAAVSLDGRTTGAFAWGTSAVVISVTTTGVFACGNSSNISIPSSLPLAVD